MLIQLSVPSPALTEADIAEDWTENGGCIYTDMQIVLYMVHLHISQP